MFSIDNYFFLISFVIYMGIIYSFYISKKEDRLNLFLTLIFIFLFNIGSFSKKHSNFRWGKITYLYNCCIKIIDKAITTS